MKRLFTLIKGLFLRLLGQAERSNPDALLEAEIENIRAQKVRFDEIQKELRARVINVENKVKADRAKLPELEAKVKALVAMGGQDELAGETALQIERLKESLLSSESMVDALKAQYEQIKEQKQIAIAEANEKINALKDKIGEVKMHRAQAEMAELTKSLTSDQLGTSGLDRLSQSLDEEVGKAQASYEVAKDEIDPTKTPEYRKHLQVEALKKYKLSK